MDNPTDTGVEREAHHLLQRLYEATGGNVTAEFDLHVLSRPHGVSRETAAQAVALLLTRGLVRQTETGLLTITEAGSALIEGEFGLSEI